MVRLLSSLRICGWNLRVSWILSKNGYGRHSLTVLLAILLLINLSLSKRSLGSGTGMCLETSRLKSIIFWEL